MSRATAALLAVSLAAGPGVLVPTMATAMAPTAQAGPVPDAPPLPAVPAGFRDDVVASVGAPTALAFTPDGRMLVTTQGGTVRVIKDQTLMPTAALDLSGQICSNSERGLLGVAVDPEFASNGYVFLYYSFRKTAVCDSTTVNRVSRFVMDGDTLAGEGRAHRQHPLARGQPQRRRPQLRQGRPALCERG